MRVVVADDSAVIREGVVRILTAGGASVVGQARTAEELLAIALPGFFRTCRGALFGGDGYARIIDCLIELEDELFEVTADGGHVRSFRIRLLEA